MVAAHRHETVELAIALYESGATGTAASEAAGISRPVLYRHLKARGVERHEVRRGNTRRFQCDDAAFDSPSEARDYWVGMMMADGCVRECDRSFIVSLSLEGTDAEHVSRFKEFLRAENPVNYSTSHGGRFTRAALTVYSKQLFESLARFGVVPRKSTKEKVIGLENSPHFWRGVVDGDGWISTHTVYNASKTRRYVLPKICLVGSERLLEQFRAFVLTLAPDCKASLTPKGAIKSYAVAGRHALPVIRALYGGCTVALPRKLALARAVSV